MREQVIAASPGVTYMTPGFAVETQRTLTWCWAAVAAAIVRLQDRCWISQCQVVDRCVPLPTSACAASIDPKARVRMSLTRVLQNPFGIPTVRSGAVVAVLPSLAPHLDAGRPPALLLKVNGRHHVALLGAVGHDASGNAVVAIADPADGYGWTDVWVARGLLHRYKTRLEAVGLW
jgi:hypothetical protein